MTIADNLLSKLAEVNSFAAHYKKRLSETFALPPVVEMRTKSLAEAVKQREYWAQREAELTTEIAEKKAQYAASVKWLDEHRAEFENVENMASDKAQKLAQKLAELLREFEAGSNADGPGDTRDDS